MKLNSLFENFSSQLHNHQNDSSDEESQLSSNQSDSLRQPTPIKFIEMMCRSIREKYDDKLRYSVEYDSKTYKLNAPYDGGCFLKMTLGNPGYEFKHNISITINHSCAVNIHYHYDAQLKSKLYIENDFINDHRFYNEYIKKVYDYGLITKEQFDKTISQQQFLISATYGLLKLTTQYFIDAIKKYSV